MLQFHWLVNRIRLYLWTGLKPAIHDTVIPQGLASRPCLKACLKAPPQGLKGQTSRQTISAHPRHRPDMLTQLIFAHRKREINKTKSNKNMIKYIHVWYFSRLLFVADHESEVFFMFYSNLCTRFLSPQYLGLKAGPQISVTDRYQADRVRPP